MVHSQQIIIDKYNGLISDMSRQQKMVDFAGLDDQNKTQFLEFLVKNNIQFQKSDVDQNTDYVAKITIKKSPKTPQSKNLKNNHKPTTPTKFTHNKQNKIQTNKKPRASASKSPQLKTPTKANNVRSSPLKSNQNNSQQQKNKYCSKQNLTPKNKQKSATKVKVGEYEPSYHRYKGVKGVHKNEKVVAQKNSNPEKNTSKSTGDLKRKTNLEKQVSELLHKYLKIFNLKLAGQRNTKWQVTQLLKLTEQIYDEVFLKTHQISTLLSKNRHKSGTTGVLPKIIKEFFIQKYKSERLGVNNLINMLYTLSYYTLTNSDNQHSKDHKNTGSNYQLSFKMFEDFVLGIYDNEDLLFFVFVRSMIKKYNINSINAFNNQVHIDDQLSESTIITNNINHTLDNTVCFHLQRDLMKILGYIFDSEKQLIDEYYSLIVEKAKESKTAPKISSIQLERILIDDYRVKRVLKSLNKSEKKGQQLVQIDTLELNTEHIPSIPQKMKGKKKEKEQKTTLRPFPSVMDLHNQYQTMRSESIAGDQLTFGDETQEEYRFEHDALFPEEGKIKNSKFWEINNKSIYQNILDSYCPEQPPINHMDSHYSQNVLNSSCLETLIINKMQKKVNELINIMMDYQSYYNSKKQNNQYISPQHNKFNISLHPNSPFFNTSSNMLETKDFGSGNKEEENQFVTEFCSMGDEPMPVEKKQIYKQVILKKCLVLLGCLIQMDKMKWFQQLHIKGQPSQSDMTVIEKLQLIYRKLKKKPEGKAIGELCKTIITVEQLTNALEDLFIDG